MFPRIDFPLSNRNAYVFLRCNSEIYLYNNVIPCLVARWRSHSAETEEVHGADRVCIVYSTDLP